MAAKMTLLNTSNMVRKFHFGFKHFGFLIDLLLFFFLSPTLHTAFQ